MNTIYRIIINISSLVAVLYCLLSLKGVYSYVSLIPITFAFSFNLSKSFSFVWSKRRITAYVVYSLLWLRMVFLPLYGCVSQAYSSHVSNELTAHFIGSVVLCIYDCIAIVLCLLMYDLGHKRSLQTLGIGHSSSSLYGNRAIYVMYVLFAVIIFFALGRGYHLFDFAIKQIGAGLEREGDITDSRFLIIRQNYMH